MKYLQIVSAPSPIESWLHSQLEARGVDRVYSRYILSLFHSSDVGDHDFLDLDIPCKELKRLNKKKSPRHLSRSVDTHKLVRASVIETLRSVAETKAGIETLVDELCDRLHSNEKTLSLPGTKSLIAAQSLNNVSVACGVVDLAQKYYDAFPALGSNPQPSTALLLASCNTSSSPWNGKHQSLLSSSVSTEKPGICVDPTSDSKVNLALPCGNPLNVTEPAPPTGQTSSLVASPGGGNAKLDQDSERRMDCSMRAKRKLFVEVEEAKDSLASLMEKVDGTKQLWGGGGEGGGGGGGTSSSLPPGFIPCGTNLTTSIWSEVECGGGAGAVAGGGGGTWSSGGDDDSGVCLASPLESEEDMMSPITSQGRIKAVLNHCSETSAFQPVVLGSKLAAPVASLPLPPPPPPVTNEGENLLTSASTHFCPIDKAPHYKAQGEVTYADGTTFSILSQLDEIDYQIGQDGTLSYDSDTYMEFKANGLNTECYNLYDPFKPKFRVFARDKSIQTEMSSGQGECKAQDAQADCGDNMEDFYFPGEESIARDIMRSLEEAEEKEGEEPAALSSPPSPLLVDAWVAWPPFSIWSNQAGADDGWPPPSHDYQELSKPGGAGESPVAAPAAPALPAPAGSLYTNYSIWAPPFPLDTNSNVILCTKCETPLPLGVNMGNLKISSDRKRRHSSSQFVGTISTFPCIKSEVSFFQQSITL